MKDKKVNNNKFIVLTLKDIVIFPKMVTHVLINQPGFIRTLKKLKHEDTLFLVSRKKSNIKELKASNLYRFGVISKILQIIKLKKDSYKILIEGLIRARVKKYIIRVLSVQAIIVPECDSIDKDKNLTVLKNAVVDCFDEYILYNKKISKESFGKIIEVDNISDFCNIICAQINITLDKKQKLLEAKTIEDKLEKILVYLGSEIDLLKVEGKIKSRARVQIEKNQKDYYLQEQLKAIYKELGDGDYKEEFNQLENKINSLNLNYQVKHKALSELKKMKMMNPMSSESTIVRNYLEWIVNLPWNVYTKENYDLKIAEKELNKEHYSLNRVKERILEYLAVNIKSQKMSGSIICFYGPPGVGKTSLVYAIAKAIGRKFAKITLGGLRDEAEIKGHRRTYIGAMPGKIIQAIRKAGSSNALILLDEIDKMSHDFRGDPASALLEVLDISQNHIFSDNYLEVDFDLSKVMFIATSNSIDLPYVLLDRMEIIKLSGYTQNDKIHIAKKHLLRRIRKSHNINKSELKIDDSVIVDIVKYYTREAGVRCLNREIEKIFRKCVLKSIVSNVSLNVNSSNLSVYLGPQKFIYDKVNQKCQIGICNGLAYTQSGGDIISIEVVKYKGKGNVKTTGQLGDIMKESIQTSYSYIYFKSNDFGLAEYEFQKNDLHIHVPEGGIPKDGPSAGITIATAIFSLISGASIKSNIAMTGEMTLRGKIISIGGLKEKLLAAIRGGIKEVIIPNDNVKDLLEIPIDIKGFIKIIPVKFFNEVLDNIIVKSRRSKINIDKINNVNIYTE